MDFTTTLGMAIERSNQLQTYWAFYATVVLGVLAFFGSAKEGQRPILVAVLVTIGFVVVATANLEALTDVSKQRLALQDMLAKLAGNDVALASLVSTITPSTLFAVRAFHYAFDIFTLAAIWVLTLRARSSRRDIGGREAE